MIGVKFPFTISGGSVVTTSDPTEIIGSRVTFLIGTSIGERIMRPAWGIDILSTVFSLGGDLEDAMEEAIEVAFTDHFPEYEPREITFNRIPDNPTYVEISVRFGRYDSDMDAVARVGTQLPGGSEIQANEGL